MADAHFAISAAFAAVERVQRLMSFHDHGSEVSRLNQFAMPQPVSVSGWTYQVLETAKELHAGTEGIFDIAIAPELMEWGMLPRHKIIPSRVHYPARSSDIDLLAGRRVRFLRPMQIDLGGIAKGFAVDKAVEALRANGIVAGLINAGGDMRCFGERENLVWVRHPTKPHMLLPLIPLKHLALATSANSYRRHYQRGRAICAHVHGQTRRPCLRPFSVSVSGTTCMVADALTKVILALGKTEPCLLARYQATSYILWPDARIDSFKGRLA